MWKDDGINLHFAQKASDMNILHQACKTFHVQVWERCLVGTDHGHEFGKHCLFSLKTI